MRKIGVFDSGMGGLSVANAIKQSLPDHEILFVNDAEHLPYGSKKPSQLLEFVIPILQDLVDQGCEVIVIACNTVTTTLIEDLRKQFSVALIGMEPMIKPAAEKTKTQTVAVCATPTTLASKRYEWLKDKYAKDITVLEPDCSDWALMIETKQLDHEKIHNRISEVCNKGADVIVLGCTHYHWIEEEIQKVANKFKAEVIQPEQPVITELTRVLEQLD